MKHYREHIRARDNNKCFICPAKKNLEVHHVNKRKNGHSYDNLITLCFHCHRFVIHKTDDSYKNFIETFTEYTSKFEEPTGWEEIVLFSIKQDKEMLKKRISKKDLDKDRKARKDYRRIQKLEYMENHGGKTLWQVQYQKQKEYKKSLLE